MKDDLEKTRIEHVAKSRQETQRIFDIEAAQLGILEDMRHLLDRYYQGESLKETSLTKLQSIAKDMSQDRAACETAEGILQRREAEFDRRQAPPPRQVSAVPRPMASGGPPPQRRRVDAYPQPHTRL